MTSVSASELGQRIFELLAIPPDGPFELTLTRDGHLLVGKPQP